MNPGRRGRHPVESMNSIAELDGRLLVVYDGQCGLCDRSAHWLLRRDRGDRLRFAVSESPRVAELLARHGFSAAGPETVLVVRDAGGPQEQVLARSEAVVALLGELPRPWPWLAVGLGWIPRAVRDVGYRLVARWRYRLWGRLESCPVPTPAERERFL
ncbi:MAG: DCC1-like thiol-disulfide oxidoreductase family protein [Terracidiphilus sp.]|nr:DCC1-like thiol-disulfide oxidoreductase family protein [Terracidiphilus sp.]